MTIITYSKRFNQHNLHLKRKYFPFNVNLNIGLPKMKFLKVQMILDEVSWHSHQCDGQSPGDVTRSLHTPDSFPHLLGVVHIRKGFLRNRDSQEFTERVPSLLHLEDQEPIWGDLPLHLLIPVVKEWDRCLLAAVHSPIHSSWVLRTKISWTPAAECCASAFSLKDVHQPEERRVKSWG